eukprot:SAG31_NODE_541_length_14275_cov_6.690886_2_plen_266_part_00
MPLSRAELDARLDGLDKAELLAVIVDAASRLERIAVDPVGACGVPSDSTAAPLSQTGTVNGYQNQATDEALVSPSASLETTCAEQHIEQVQHLEESPGRADVAQQLASHFQADIASHSLTLINPARLKAVSLMAARLSVLRAIPCAYCSAQPRRFSVHKFDYTVFPCPALDTGKQYNRTRDSVCILLGSATKFFCALVSVCVPYQGRDWDTVVLRRAIRTMPFWNCASGCLCNRSRFRAKNARRFGLAARSSEGTASTSQPQGTV